MLAEKEKILILKAQTITFHHKQEPSKHLLGCLEQLQAVLEASPWRQISFGSETLLFCSLSWKTWFLKQKPGEVFFFSLCFSLPLSVFCLVSEVSGLHCDRQKSCWVLRHRLAQSWFHNTAGCPLQTPRRGGWKATSCGDCKRISFSACSVLQLL